MNSRTKFFAFIIFMFGAMVANASANTTVIAGTTTGVYKLVYKGTEAGKVKVSILNENRDLIFTETLANVESFIRPYNFSNLSQGNYTFVIEDKNGKTEEKVNYSFKKVASAIEVSKIANEVNKYLLSIENKESDLVDVKIIDAENNILHEQAMNVNGKFSVIYNLSTIKGGITFEVTGSNGETKTIKY